MLQVTAHPPSVKEISGRRLARRIKHGISPTHKALLAYAMEHREVLLHELTRRQSMALTRASAGYIATVTRLTAECRPSALVGQNELIA